MKVMSVSRGQSTIEFMIMFGSIIFFFIVFVTVIQLNTIDKNQDKERLLLQNVALNVRDEISFAAESSDGYIREFTIPESILGKNYTIYLNESKVVYSMDTLVSSYVIVNVTGDVQKGVNVIKKENGTIFIN